jgi:hypothetical protein
MVRIGRDGSEVCVGLQGRSLVLYGLRAFLKWPMASSPFCGAMAAFTSSGHHRHAKARRLDVSYFMAASNDVTRIIGQRLGPEWVINSHRGPLETGS